MLIPSPVDLEKRVAFTNALSKVGQTLIFVYKDDLEKCEELFDRVVSAKAALLTSLGRQPAILLDHCKWTTEWIEWRIAKDYLCDSILFHAIDCEAQLLECKTPTLLNSPTADMIQECNGLIERIEKIKLEMMKRGEQNVNDLTAKIDANDAIIAALKAKDKEMDARLEALEKKLAK